MREKKIGIKISLLVSILIGMVVSGVTINLFALYGKSIILFATQSVYIGLFVFVLMLITQTFVEKRVLIKVEKLGVFCFFLAFAALIAYFSDILPSNHSITLFWSLEISFLLFLLVGIFSYIKTKSKLSIAFMVFSLLLFLFLPAVWGFGTVYFGV